MPYADPEKRKAHSAEYQKKHRERLRRQNRAREAKRTPEQKQADLARRREQYALNPRIKTRERERVAKIEPKKKSASRRHQRYGITLQQYESLLERQKSCCALCGDPLKLGTKSFHIDHNHRTDQVRGILCARCNLGLGRFGDDIQGMMNAIHYLINHDNEPTWMSTWTSPWPL